MRALRARSKEFATEGTSRVVAVPHNRVARKRFFRGRTESTADYRLRSRSPGKTEVTIRLRRVRYRRGGKRRTEVSAVRRMGRMTDDRLRAHSRRRFAIESSYRQLREVKAPTTSRDRVWRLLLVGLALVFRQVWAGRDADRDAGVPPASGDPVEGAGVAGRARVGRDTRPNPRRPLHFHAE